MGTLIAEDAEIRAASASSAVSPSVREPERIRTAQDGRRFYSARSAGEAVTVLRRPGFRDGYNDMLAGLPFDHDRPSRRHPLFQRYYEEGRRFVAAARAAGFRLTPWHSPRVIPLDLLNAAAAAVERKFHT